MKKIGFLGCGKIGQTLLRHAREEGYAEVVFVEDPFVELPNETVIHEPDEKMYQKVNLIIECATADVLKSHIELILSHGDLLMFSITAFSDDAFCRKTEELCSRYGRRIYLPHGAILGIDGIFDGRRIWNKVTIETIKNPKSLGRDDACRKVVYEGLTREACRQYPRNVNVHAAVALAGLGFDKTQSRIISDPAVDTNFHVIHLEGDGIHITMQVESFAAGAVTGAYTPYSACGSLDRICSEKCGVVFV